MSSILTLLCVASPLAAVERTFTGAVSNDWLVADNWIPKGVPGVADVAVIEGGVSIELAADTIVDGFTLAGGTLNGAGSLTVLSLLNWSGGSLSGSGTINTSGSMLISGAGTKTLARLLNISGNAIWADNGNLVLNGGRLNITASGELAIQNDRPMIASGGSARVDNAGTLSKSSSGVTSLSNLPLNSTGTIQVQNGTLSLSGGGAYSGIIDASHATLQFSGGTHNLGRTVALTADSLICDSGTVNAQAQVTVTNRTLVNAGALNLTGTVHALGAVTLNNGTLNVSPGMPAGAASLSMSAGNLIGSAALSIDGPMVWTGGTLSGTGAVTAQGSLVLAGNNPKALARPLSNARNAAWSDNGPLNFSAAGVLANFPDATWLIETDADISGDGSGRINNAGTVRKLSSGRSRVSGVAFDNSGSLEVQAGVLELAGGGQHSGSFEFPEAQIELGGSHVFGVTARVAGNNFVVNAGTVLNNGRWDINGSTEVDNGAVILNGDIVGLGNLRVRGGSLDLNPVTGGLGVPLLMLSGGELTGSVDLSVNGPFTWSAGTMSGGGVTYAKGGLRLDSSNTKMLRRTLNNSGEAVWIDAGGISLSGSGRLVNLAGATFSIQNDALLAASDEARLVNLGVLRKDAGAATRITAGVDNAGTVQVFAGEIALLGGGDHLGVLESSAGGVELAGDHTFAATSHLSAPRVVFSGGTTTVGGSYAANETIASAGIVVLSGSVATTGALTISNATLQIDTGGTVTVPSLQLDFGVLQGMANVAVTGALLWSAGSMRGAGSTDALGTLQITGNGPKTLNRRLRNAGRGQWSDNSNFSIGDSGVFTNLSGASFEILGDGSVIYGGGSAHIDNAGTLSKTQGALSSIAAPVNNSGTLIAANGTLALNGGYEQSAGTTRLDGGSLRADLGMVIRAGQLEGNGTIAGSVTNGGTLNPGLSPGRLVIDGNYLHASSALYRVELGGTSDVSFDQVAVDNQIALGGNLAIEMFAGFTPHPGDRFRILSGQRLLSDFEHVQGLVLDVGKGFQRLVTATEMTLVYGEEICDDQQDNDGDQQVDCADPKCAAFLPCTFTPTPTATPTATPSPSPTATPTVTVTPTATASRTATARLACFGDCDENGAVTIDELLRAVNIALGLSPAALCPSADANRDGGVEIDEIVIAVNRALLGC